MYKFLWLPLLCPPVLGNWTDGRMKAYVYFSSAVVITPSAVLVCSCTPRSISDSGSAARKASSLAASRAHSGRMLVSAFPLASLGASFWVTVATAGALDGIAEVSGVWCCPCAIWSISRGSDGCGWKVSESRVRGGLLFTGGGACGGVGTSVGLVGVSALNSRGKRGTE